MFTNIKYDSILFCMCGLIQPSHLRLLLWQNHPTDDILGWMVFTVGLS